MEGFLAQIPSEAYISLTFALLGGVGTYLVSRNQGTLRTFSKIRIGIFSVFSLVVGVVLTLLLIWPAVSSIF